MAVARGEVDYPAPHLSEAFLKDFGVLPSPQHVQDARTIYDNRGSDGWIYGYRIEAVDESTGQQATVYLKEKHMLSFAQTPADMANHHLDRVRRLEALGIPTPRTYGVHRGALLQEFIVHEETDRALRQIRKGATKDVREPLDQLIAIAGKLDESIFIGDNFTGDLLFDADRNVFVYNDVGSDLGSRSLPVPGYHGARDHLTRVFEAHREYIGMQYPFIRAESHRRAQAA